MTSEHGVDVVRVLDEPETGKRMKTEASRCVVPIHPELKRIGFLEFVARQRAAGHDHVFAELKRDRRGYRTNALQKAVNRQIERAGAAAPRTTFHSFRHCFRDGLREADVPRDAVLALGGWKAGGTEEIYGGGLRPVPSRRCAIQISTWYVFTRTSGCMKPELEPPER